MKRVVIDHFGGARDLEVVEEDDPQTGSGRGPRRGAGRRRVVHRCAAGAGTYLGVPKPPFTPGYELVGVVGELGPGGSRLRRGDRIGALTEWGAEPVVAERRC